MIRGIAYSVFLFCAFTSLGQDTTKVQEFDEIVIDETRLFQRLKLYDEYEEDDRPNIRGFDQLNLYADNFSDEVWASKDQDCIILSQEEDDSDVFLKVHWNKDHPDCDWVGFGFGWDFWTGKDMAPIIDTAAVQLTVRSTGKNINNLPWAMGFEDYAGGQAWIGFSSKFIDKKIITNEWSTVTIPLGLFPFEQRDCDVSNIKQMLFQVFAEDELEINDVTIVPFAGKLKKEIASQNIQDASKRALDGKMDDWSSSEFEGFGEGHSFSLAHDENSLFIAVKLNDDTPRMNVQTGADLWKGDAIEFAFSTNPTANPKRTSFLLSDYHFGVNLGPQPYLWNWSEDMKARNGNFAISEDGKFVEIAIALEELAFADVTSLNSIGFEIAVDASESGKERDSQQRWNSEGEEGFHLNPSMWGKLIL